MIEQNLELRNTTVTTVKSVILGFLNSYNSYIYKIKNKYLNDVHKVLYNVRKITSKLNFTY